MTPARRAALDALEREFRDLLNAQPHKRVDTERRISWTSAASAMLRRMETDVLRRLNYAAAIACGVFAALAMHIVLTVFGVGLDAVLRTPPPAASSN